MVRGEGRGPRIAPVFALTAIDVDRAESNRAGAAAAARIHQVRILSSPPSRKHPNTSFPLLPSHNYHANPRIHTAPHVPGHPTHQLRLLLQGLLQPTPGHLEHV